MSTPKSYPVFSVQNSEHTIPSITLFIGRMEIWRVVPVGEVSDIVLEKLMITSSRDGSLEYTVYRSIMVVSVSGVKLIASSPNTFTNTESPFKSPPVV